MKTIETTVEIRNSLGLHARPASMFAQCASKYKSNIFVKKNGNEVNGKSLMGLLMLAAGHGSKIELVISGEDADHAHQAILDLIESNFNEE